CQSHGHRQRAREARPFASIPHGGPHFVHHRQGADAPGAGPDGREGGPGIPQWAPLGQFFKKWASASFEILHSANPAFPPPAPPVALPIVVGFSAPNENSLSSNAGFSR